MTPPGPGASRPRRNAALAGLCVIEFCSWGVLYYTLPVIGTAVTSDAGWPPFTIPAVYTASLLVAAAAAPWAGRLIDRHGPRRVMALGSVVGGAAVALAGATSWAPLFAVAWLVVGAAQAGTLYPPAFAAAAQWFGTTRTGPLTAITVAGGVSSTVFAPVSALLVEGLDWRATLLLLGAGYALVSGVAAVALLRAPWRLPARHGAEQADYVAEIVGSRTFRDSRLALAVAALGLYAVTLNLIPLLTELGFGYREAAIVFGLVGAGQVVGRLVFVPLSVLGTPRTRTVTQVSLSAASIGLLAAVPGPPLLVTSSAVLCGAVRGAHTLSVAKVVSDRWGVESYGTLLGRFHGVVAVAMAVGPAVGTAAALALDSYRLAALALAVLGVSAVAIARRT